MASCVSTLQLVRRAYPTSELRVFVPEDEDKRVLVFDGDLTDGSGDGCGEGWNELMNEIEDLADDHEGDEDAVWCGVLALGIPTSAAAGCGGEISNSLALLPSALATYGPPSRRLPRGIRHRMIRAEISGSRAPDARALSLQADGASGALLWPGDAAETLARPRIRTWGRTKKRGRSAGLAKREITNNLDERQALHYKLALEPPERTKLSLYLIALAHISTPGKVTGNNSERKFICLSKCLR
jgi:hypothetical protein